MKLAIADPPYPPLFRERFDLAGGRSRVTSRSRATRWYGDGTRSSTDSPRADLHPEAARWDDLSSHRELLLHLVDNYDGWAIATTPDGLGAYHPLPLNAQIMAWHRPTAMPGGGRLIERWEPVIVYIPQERRTRAGMRVSNVLTAAAPAARNGRQSFVGSKPAEWTRWVLDALGYDPSTDELVDLFPGSGAVSAAADGMLPLTAAVPLRAESPHRVQLSRRKGYRKPENTVVVARPSKWGNPYTIDQWGRVWAVRGFRAALEEGRLTRFDVDDVRRDLAGKNLACWCPLDQPCHADVLLELANGEAS